jgi:hypothetical protein
MIDLLSNEGARSWFSLVDYGRRKLAASSLPQTKRWGVRNLVRNPGSYKLGTVFLVSVATMFSQSWSYRYIYTDTYHSQVFAVTL